MEITTPRNPLNITQAFNYLKELKVKLVGKIKKTMAEEAKISVALPADRVKFLRYGISLLERVDQENMDLFYEITGFGRRLYSGTEMADMFKKILILRINHYSIEQIAHILHTPVDVMKQVEQLAIISCNRAIEKAQAGKVPLIGGL